MLGPPGGQPSTSQRSSAPEPDPRSIAVLVPQGQNGDDQHNQKKATWPLAGARVRVRGKMLDHRRGETEPGSQPPTHLLDCLVHLGHTTGTHDERVLTRGY